MMDEQDKAINDLRTSVARMRRFDKEDDIYQYGDKKVLVDIRELLLGLAALAIADEDTQVPEEPE